MAVNIIYACPGTEAHPAHQFAYFHYPDKARDPLPRFCGICGYDSEAETFTAQPSMPHIEKSIRRAGDATFRQMEGQAEERMDMAADMTGLDRSEFNDLKITDIKDNLREGDTANVDVVNDVTKAMEQAPQDYGFRTPLAPAAAGGGGSIPDQFGITPNQHAARAHSGPHAFAGARAADMVRNAHIRNPDKAGTARQIEKRFNG